MDLTFDNKFQNHPIIKLLNSNSTTIGTFSAKNNGIMVPVDATPDMCLTFVDSFPNKTSVFPSEVLDIVVDQKLIDLERRVFPFPDEVMLKNMVGCSNKIIDFLFFLRTNPFKIASKYLQKRKDHVTIDRELNLNQKIGVFNDEIKDLGVNIFHPQRYSFQDSKGEIFFAITPGGQLINFDQLEYTMMKYKSNLEFSDSPDIFERREIQKNEMIVKVRESELDVCFYSKTSPEFKKLKLLYSLSGLTFMEKQKYSRLLI